jgi:hypothetical protein
MKRTPSSTLVVTNALLLAILGIFTCVVFAGPDPLWWVTRAPGWLERIEPGILLLLFLLLFVVSLVTLTLAVVDVWRGGQGRRRRRHFSPCERAS